LAAHSVAAVALARAGVCVLYGRQDIRAIAQQRSPQIALSCSGPCYQEMKGDSLCKEGGRDRSKSAIWAKI